MSRPVVVGGMVGAFLVAAVADGAVLCQRRSGAVVVREACRKKEQALDLTQFGAVGPAGPTGPIGPQGPPGSPGAAGTARAYAAVSSTGTVISKGGQYDVTVVKPGAGEYCVVVPAAIQAVNGAAVATLATPGGTDVVTIGSFNGSACNPLQTETTQAFPVYIRSSGNVAVDRGFHIVIP